MKIACSACLLGMRCRYDGGARPSDSVIALGERHELVPICPERLGGLKAPRAASEIDMSLSYPYVRDADGVDVTDAFLKGARKTFDIVSGQGCDLAIMKEKSPSCGVSKVFDGTFSGHLVPGCGIATRCLRENGIRVISDEMLPTCTDALFSTSANDTVTLRTERLVLRPLVPEDAHDLFSCYRDPSVGPRAGWPPHRSLEDTRAFIEGMGAAPHVFGIALAVFDGLAGADVPPTSERVSFPSHLPATDGGDACASGRVIGSIGLIADPLRRNPDCLMLGYSLGRPWWGRGYMTEAAREVIAYGFRDLGLSLVSAECYPGNDRSRAVLERCGFQREGMLREVETVPDGRMEDVISYSMTRAEYFFPHPAEAQR